MGDKLEKYIEELEKMIKSYEKRGLAIMLTSIMMGGISENSLLRLGWLLVFFYGLYEFYKGEW